MLRRRFSCGVSAGVLLGLRAIATILSMIEFAKDAIAFGDPCFRNPAADRAQPGVIEKIGIAIAAIGHGPGHMAEVRLKRMQAGAIVLADKVRKGLSALMGVQMPWLALVMR